MKTNYAHYKQGTNTINTTCYQNHKQTRHKSMRQINVFSYVILCGELQRKVLYLIDKDL